PAEPREGRVERVQARRRRAKAAVLVTRTRALLDPREMEERLRELVPVRTLAALDELPGLGAVGEVIPEPDVRGTHRVEYPARPALDSPRAHPTALRPPP